MNRIDKFFDINMVLMSLFSSLETIRDEKSIELIYDIDASIPKELRGNAELLSGLLTQMLTFVFENTKKREIVLSLSAPEDFLYEESISFEIKEIDINQEKVVSFLDNRLNKNLELLGGEIIHENENPSDIHVNIPFKLNELGNRRYYRLPDIAMLGKKVLLICESQKVSHCIEKMFKYFLYDVVVGINEFKRLGSDMTQYDILIIESKLTTDGFEKFILKVQKGRPLKYVLLQDANYVESKNVQIASACLVKPVMQESIFELIVSLFEDEMGDRSIKSRDEKMIIDMERYINKGAKKEEENLTTNSFDTVKKKSTKIEEIVLNTEIGEQNAKKFNQVYTKELQKFLDSFDRSDLYFRQIVNEKQTWQIKEFCIDLEKQAKPIGAQSMSSFAERVSLLFVYDKLDTLPIYTGKYHKELKKLITEIKMYLNS